MIDRAGGWTLATFGMQERDVWLVQPVSPRLQHEALASKLGFQWMGFLPPALTDDPRRLVLVWISISHGSREEAQGDLEDSKWVAGFKEEHWTESGYPFGEPDARIRYPEHLKPEAYTHSTELSKWP